MENYINTEKWEQWESEGGLVSCQDIMLNKVIPIDIGVGVVEVDGNGDIWTSTREYGGRNKNYLKTITIDITTFIGTGADAVHYYGRLESPSVDFICPKYPTRSKSVAGSGVPHYLENIEIDLTNILTQEMVNNQGPKRWEYYHIGDVTTRFDSVKDVIERGKEIFDKWFDPQWKLVVKKSWSNTVEKLN